MTASTYDGMTASARGGRRRLGGRSLFLSASDQTIDEVFGAVDCGGVARNKEGDQFGDLVRPCRQADRNGAQAQS
jgi:hypothetical protein